MFYGAWKFNQPVVLGTQKLTTTAYVNTLLVLVKFRALLNDEAP